MTQLIAYRRHLHQYPELSFEVRDDLLSLLKWKSSLHAVISRPTPNLRACAFAPENQVLKIGTA